MPFLLPWRALTESLTCKSQATAIPSNLPGPKKVARRSGCPVSVSLDLLGDRWSLLIIRDLMVRGFRTFREFQESGEGISTNILADRLRKLEGRGIIAAEAEETDRRRVNYRLTEKGIDLAPVVLELLIWGRGTSRRRRPRLLSRTSQRIVIGFLPKSGDGGGRATRLR